MDATAAATSSPSPSFSSSGSDGSEEMEKMAVAAHPLYERLMEAHVACFRIPTPFNQLPPQRFSKLLPFSGRTDMDMQAVCISDAAASNSLDLVPKHCPTSVQP